MSTRHRFADSRIRKILYEERGNCFLYGCVTLVILAILGGLVAFLSYRYLVLQIRDKYTEAEPTSLPTVEMPADEVQSLIDRVDQYAKDLRAGNPLPPLTLTQDQVNALLQNQPDVKGEFGGHVYVTFEGDNKVKCQLSVPMDWIPGLGGRYFNGTGTFETQIQDGRFTIFLESAEVKGEPVPEAQVAQLKSKNFAEDLFSNPDARKLIDNVKSLSITGDKVTIVPVHESESGSSTPEASKDETTPEAA